MITTEIEKSKLYILNEIVEYAPNLVVSKTIIQKASGNISIMAFDAGQALDRKIAPFDTFIQVIEGIAEVIIDAKLNRLQTGQGIIIPAHTSNAIKANGRFKIMLTVMKSGYDEALI